MIAAVTSRQGSPIFRYDVSLAIAAEGARKRDRTRAQICLAASRFLDANPLAAP